MGLISRVSSRTYRSLMKLLTHNFLQSIVKGVSKPYPLGIKCTELEKYDVDFSENNVKKILARVEYTALLSALGDLGYSHNLPEQLPGDLTDELLKQLHHVLFEVEVIEGSLVCPESGREFPVTRGI